MSEHSLEISVENGLSYFSACQNRDAPKQSAKRRFNSFVFDIYMHSRYN